MREFHGALQTALTPNGLPSVIQQDEVITYKAHYGQGWAILGTTCLQLFLLAQAELRGWARSAPFFFIKQYCLPGSRSLLYCNACPVEQHPSRDPSDPTSKPLVRL